MARRYATRPSALLGITDPVAALTLDEATWSVGVEDDVEEIKAIAEAGLPIAPRLR
jgi:hypothetical protein